MLTAPAPTFEFVGNWTTDGRSIDPSARIRWVKVDGVQFSVRNLLGPGWPMTIQHKGHHVHMADWENWDQVAANARAFLANN